MTTIAEILLPGVGFLYTGQLDKAILAGPAGWAARNRFFEAIESDDYQDDPGDYYETEEEDD